MRFLAIEMTSVLKKALPQSLEQGGYEFRIAIDKLAHTSSHNAKRKHKHCEIGRAVRFEAALRRFLHATFASPELSLFKVRSQKQQSPVS